jgi:hypothetical protein
MFAALVGRDSRCMTTARQQNSIYSRGSLDGEGAADHDQPYRFGRKPRASAPYPFSTRQYARLLILRGRIPNRREPDVNPATA